MSWQPPRPDPRGAALALACVLATATCWIRAPWFGAAAAGTVLLCGAALLVAAALRHPPPAGFPHTFLPAILMAIVAPAQVVLGISVSPSATWRSAFAWAALAVFVSAAWRWSAPAVRRAVLDVLATAGAVLAGVYLVQSRLGAGGGKILGLFDSGYPNVYATFLNYNHFAALLELALPVALWRALAPPHPRPLPAMAAALMVAAAVDSGSRAGAALVLAETLAVLLLLRRGRIRRILLPAAALSLAVAAGVAWFGSGALLERLKPDDSIRYRAAILASTLKMIETRPWTGYGLGTFETVYPRFRTFDNGQIVNHAHDDWVELAAEAGIPVALLAVALAALAVFLGAKSVWGLGIAGVLLHAGVDYPLHDPGIAVWLAVLAGFLPEAGPTEKGRPRTARRPEEKESNAVNG